jgi:hypothetical protein
MMVRRRIDDPYIRKPPRWAYLRSFLPVLILILLFSFALSSYSLLSHYRGPAKKQQIGWQAWDIVQVSAKHGETVGDVEIGGEEEQDFVPSIPLDNWVGQYNL